MPTDKCSSPHPSPRKTSLQQTETITDTHNPSKCSIVESSPNEYIYKTFLHLMLKELLYKVARLQEPENQGVCCEIVFPRNVTSYTHKVSPTWLSKHELNKDNTDRHAKVYERQPIRPQPYTKNYKQLGLMWVGKTIFLSGKCTLTGYQYQMVPWQHT